MTGGDVAAAHSIKSTASRPSVMFGNSALTGGSVVGEMKLQAASGNDVIQKQGRRPFSKGGPPRVNAFTNLVEHTVDAMRESGSGQSYEDLRRLLAEIRKQFDDVHCQADRVESEVAETRRESRILELEANVPPEALAYSKLTREDLIAQDASVCQEIFAAREQKLVYQHMLARMRRELKIVQQKTMMMENHLNRKVCEVVKKQDYSRRVLRENVQSLHNLENMEHDIELERMVCSAALDDLDMSLQQRRSEVRHREEFERWRYEVAMEAATEAFQASAGRLRKLYAIEKLTGSCLQKVIFEQAEQSQATEDGFQRIREVTGLTDVMDIVHKFLNRDVEHEQLKVIVREAEVRLHALRDADGARQGEHTSAGLEVKLAQPLGLAAEVTQQEYALSKALRDDEEIRKQLRDDVLLVSSITDWTHRMRASLAAFETLDVVESPKDIIPFFSDMAQTIDRFMTRADTDLPAAKLCKLTSQATSREHAEQSKLLSDKDFLRSNCRVPASLDPKPTAPSKMKHTRQQATDEEEDAGIQFERERLKMESRSKASERDARRGVYSGNVRRGRHEEEDDLVGTTTGSVKNATSSIVVAGTAQVKDSKQQGVIAKKIGVPISSVNSGGSSTGPTTAIVASRARPLSSRGYTTPCSATKRVSSARPSHAGGAVAGSGIIAARAAAAQRTPR
eukprot:TRINITY_DN30465_c0_g1_i1.p1 TRINITY_DN30465_c0_g1~~TRINITY_DN30465_c0_g1_i1.p1  ORF type:complete len:700 (-),score=131.53 TRINITY_DN30465_c0_g1_i1:200-2242(-)